MKYGGPCLSVAYSMVPRITVLVSGKINAIWNGWAPIGMGLYFLSNVRVVRTLPALFCDPSWMLLHLVGRRTLPWSSDRDCTLQGLSAREPEGTFSLFGFSTLYYATPVQSTCSIFPHWMKEGGGKFTKVIIDILMNGFIFTPKWSRYISMNPYMRKIPIMVIVDPMKNKLFYRAGRCRSVHTISRVSEVYCWISCIVRNFVPSPCSRHPLPWLEEMDNTSADIILLWYVIRRLCCSESVSYHEAPWKWPTCLTYGV